MRREGWQINHKKTHRIYCLKGLNLRRKRLRRHVSAARRQQRPALTHIDQCWSMDFVSDSLFNRRHFRAPTVVKNDWFYLEQRLDYVIMPGIRPRYTNWLSSCCRMLFVHLYVCTFMETDAQPTQ
ncbi:TPA: hypothetical protein NPP81_003957 [Klebsiella quasipneumoniae subsp. quasipneumoniae]|nr:hypothetical protein [Klebsiella quasipneumoniae subsp. quasipneumoniae]